jgi:hypothetical protein
MKRSRMTTRSAGIFIFVEYPVCDVKKMGVFAFGIKNSSQRQHCTLRETEWRVFSTSQTPF